ncbi:MAG TPA: TonB-dependent receptor [Burkholderiaceae bacterium]|nr:TonB-dependent receptor [Burkholderiaceae bacterium]
MDQKRWTAPASIDIVDGDELRDGQLQVNLSEGLGGVPGLTLRTRQNYAQDLQLSIRGFGARSTFGVRGVRLYVDGIPASAPDGQGQTANFPLGSAERVEIVRGPYSALYGSSAGGAIALYTADNGKPQWQAGVAAGADGLWRASTQASGHAGAWNYSADLSAFGTEGLRPQSAAQRDTAHVKLSRGYDGGRIVLIANRHISSAQDPLGLSRAEFDADPDQTTPAASRFDTRKSVQQSQLGVAWEHALGGGHRVEAMAYGGHRELVQYQAIVPAAQAAPGSGGGVIGLDRDYAGVDLRWRFDRRDAQTRFTATAGLSSDWQDEQRKGWENFLGTAAAPTALGVIGRLRRDESNNARTLDPYAQVEWERGDWTASAGVRHSQVRLDSQDHFIATGNADDSGSVSYSATMPVAGLRWRLAPELQAYASAGRGFETPTLNEVAYRPSGASGLNTGLRAATSRSIEAGLRGRHEQGSWTAAAFDIVTHDEIVVLTNSGGRSVFQNAGRTRRRGLELAGQAQWGPVHLTSSYTWLDAIYLDSFSTCEATPCTTPTVLVPAGNRMPGIARQQAYVRLDWAQGWAGAVLGLELRHSGAVPVNDRNSDAAAGWTVANLIARFQQSAGPWRWREFVRLDNFTDRRYAGSVIVNESGGRFFETAPGRSFFAGVELARDF